MREKPGRMLDELHDVFGSGPLFAETDQVVFEHDGVTIVCGWETGSTPERFYIVKQPPFVEAYLEVCQQFRGSTIVELGIAEGGSTALLALAASPRKLVSVELAPEPVAALEGFIDQRGLRDVVVPVYGVDQADHAGLARAVDEHLDGVPIDLVIDDASHLLDETRSSFETLFPRLRPGGLYLIEDWRNDQMFRDTVRETLERGTDEERAAFAAEIARSLQGGTAQPKPRPLTDLAVELVLCAASWRRGAVDEVTLTPFWIAVRRGTEPIDAETFRLRDVFRDHWGYLS
jgi:predicted O-methyltransferase YrrM